MVPSCMFVSLCGLESTRLTWRQQTPKLRNVKCEIAYWRSIQFQLEENTLCLRTRLTQNIDGSALLSRALQRDQCLISSFFSNPQGIARYGARLYCATNQISMQRSYPLFLRHHGFLVCRFRTRYSLHRLNQKKKNISLL